MTLLLWEATTGGSPLGQTSTLFQPTDAPLRTQRYKHTKTIAGETAARIFSQIRFNVSNGNPVDLTLRIGRPQIEKKDFATSPIAPPAGTLAQTTRAADIARLQLAGLPFKDAEGTLIVDQVIDGLTGAGELGRDALAGSGFDRISVRTTSNPANDAIIVNSGSTIWDSSGSNFTVPARRRTGLTYGPDGAILVINGTVIATMGPASLPTGLKRLDLSHTYMSRTVQEVCILPRWFSAPELQKWTTL